MGNVAARIIHYHCWWLEDLAGIKRGAPKGALCARLWQKRADRQLFVAKRALFWVSPEWVSWKCWIHFKGIKCQNPVLKYFLVCFCDGLGFFFFQHKKIVYKGYLYLVKLAKPKPSTLSSVLSVAMGPLRKGKRNFFTGVYLWWTKVVCPKFGTATCLEVGF